MEHRTYEKSPCFTRGFFREIAQRTISACLRPVYHVSDIIYKSLTLKNPYINLDSASPAKLHEKFNSVRFVLPPGYAGKPYKSGQFFILSGAGRIFL
jgi:hypothetical protein